MQKSVSVIPAKAGIQAPQMIEKDMSDEGAIKPTLSFRASPRVEESRVNNQEISRQARDDNTREESEEEKKRQYEALKERMTKAS